MAWRTITLNANGGTLGDNSPATLYYYTVDGRWATAPNAGDEYRIASIPKAKRPNYIFTGFWTGTDGSGTLCVDDRGRLIAPINFTADATIYAGWRAYSKVTLAAGSVATGGTVEFYHGLAADEYFADAALTTPISSITVPTGGGKLVGFFKDGQKLIDENGALTEQLLALNPRSDITLTAAWFSGVTDYFDLASDALVPVKSDSGDTYQRVAVAHAGKYEKDGNTDAAIAATSGIWRNPSVTYVVKADTTVAVRLGKGFAATFTGSGSSRRMTVSGYMITDVEIVSEIGKFTTVTVSAVANEGANSINNFTVNANKFDVSVPVEARSKAQNLLGAISGGGYLQRVTLRATCEPVVLQENLMPCASDIVNGRFELSAETIAPGGEAAPTAAGGFTFVGVPRAEADCEFMRYSVDARKEMV